MFKHSSLDDSLHPQIIPRSFYNYNYDSSYRITGCTCVEFQVLISRSQLSMFNRLIIITKVFLFRINKRMQEFPGNSRFRVIGFISISTRSAPALLAIKLTGGRTMQAKSMELTAGLSSGKRLFF